MSTDESKVDVHRYKLNLKREFFPSLPKKHFALSGPVPDKIDLRDKLGAVYNQSSIGACSANALSAAFYAADNSMVGSRLFLYYNERALDLIGAANTDIKDVEELIDDTGATLSSGVKALSVFGICDEESYPYDVAKFSSRPSLALYAQALKHRVLVSQQLSQNLYSIKACLSSGTPVVFGFDVHESFMSESTAKSGIVIDPPEKEQIVGAHAVVLCGYDDTVDPKHFIVRNSWGDQWGDKGYCYMSQNFVMTNNCTDFWILKQVTKNEQRLGELLDENINIDHLKNSTDERPKLISFPSS